MAIRGAGAGVAACLTRHGCPLHMIQPAGATWRKSADLLRLTFNRMITTTTTTNTSTTLDSLDTYIIKLKTSIS